MDALRALLAGPPSYEPAEYIDWLYRTQLELGKSPQKHLADVARPVREAADLLVKANDEVVTEADQQATVAAVTAKMAEAQAVAMYAFLEEFRKAADAVTQEAKKQKPGSPQRAQIDATETAFREVYLALSGAYNAAVKGDLEGLKQFPAAFERAERLVRELKR